ncbi:MAG TPA: ABC transporter permease [Blastocatellia bacterium]|nr:ABC transporter permease [Blastocatellia bacterium]
MLKNYIKIAFKVLLRRKFFTFISLFAISFTLIVLMVATSMLDHVFGKQAPETRLDRTVGVFQMVMKSPDNQGAWSGTVGYGFLDKYVRTLPNVEKVSILSEINLVNSFKNGEKIQSYMKRTDGEFWQILQFDFLEGGPFTSDDEKTGRFVAVINDATRKKFFGNDSAVGKTIDADGRQFRVVGVVSNVPFMREIPFADIWVPISTTKDESYRTQLMGDFIALILAHSTQDFPAIKQEFQSRLPHVEFPDPKSYNHMIGFVETYAENKARIVTLGDENTTGGHTSRLIAAIVVLMILFMLLPTINLVNINMSRIMERASEIGVRKAFGASSATLVGQFVTENVLITLASGVLGLVGSMLVLSAISNSGLIPYAEFHLNYRIFLYGLLTAVFFGLFSGVYPAWRMSRLNPVQALKGGAR